MSGGSFDYACYKTSQFADDLRNRLQEQGKDPSGGGWPNAIWKTDVACKLAEIAAFADYIAALMKEAEWLYSGDTGEDTFIERMKQIEATRGVMRLSSRAESRLDVDIQPDTVHRFVPVFKMPAGSIYTAEGKIDFASAANPDFNGAKSCDKLAGVLHVEIDPANLTFVKVEMVEP